MTKLCMINEEGFLPVKARCGLDLKVIVRTLICPDILCQVTFPDQKLGELAFNILVFNIS